MKVIGVFLFIKKKNEQMLGYSRMEKKKKMANDKT